MVKATPFLPSANGGEFSPRMDARVDYEKYVSAISRGLNLICLPQGGVTFRPGARFIKEIKDSSTKAALIPFEPVSTRAYQIEAGVNYARFYRNQGQLAAPTVATVITNGAFPSNISGWTNLSTGSGTIVWSAGRMAITGAQNGFGWTQQALTVVAGDQAKSHVIRFTLAGQLGSRATIQVGLTSANRELLYFRNMGMGSHTVAFTPGAGTVYFQVLNEQADTLFLDDVSVISNAPIEIASPYAEVDVGALHPAQSADVLYLFHIGYAPYKIERRGDLAWSLVRVFFQDGPWLSINPDTDLGEANLIKDPRFDTGVGTYWVQTTSGSGFIDYQQRTALFRNATGGAGTALLEQTITTGAATALHVIHFQIVGGGQVFLTVGTGPTGGSGGGDLFTAGFNAGWYSVSFTPNVTIFYVAFSATTFAAISGGVGAAFCYHTGARLLKASALKGSVTLTALGAFKPFASTDVGRLVRLEHAGREPGWCVITGFTNSQTVTVFTYRAFASIEPTETWRLGAWSDTDGWPHTGALYQQRLFAAGSPLRPQTAWASQTADFENMRPDAWVTGASTVQDTSALDFTLASTRVSPIRWFLGTSRRLIIGTGSGQWAVISRNAALTPSDLSAEPQTNRPSLDILPIQIDTVGVFGQRAKRSVYELGYSYDVDSLKASDITVLADHITRGNVAQLAYQAEPFSNVWARLETGTLACLTYKRPENVVGWTPIEIAGSLASNAVVESIATIPGDSDTGQVYSSLNRDEVWMIVKRTIGGVTKRYIEVMEGFFDGPNRAAYDLKSDWEDAVKAAQVDAFHVDCGLTYKGTPTSTISGLNHLIGETVKIVADGAVQSDKVVSGSGSVTLDLAASTIHAGLGYPWEYRSLKLPFGSPSGSAVGQTKAVNALLFVLRDAAAFEYAIEMDNEDRPLDWNPVPFRSPSDPMGGAVALFSGETDPIFAVDGGYFTDPRVRMRGTAPLPWTLLGLAPRVAEEQL